jgi:hypothetical protein
LFFVVLSTGTTPLSSKILLANGCYNAVLVREHSVCGVIIQCYLKHSVFSPVMTSTTMWNSIWQSWRINNHVVVSGSAAEE